MAYPRVNDLGEAQTNYPRTLTGAVQLLSLPTNSTNAPPQPPAPVGVINCFNSGQSREPTDVAGCRPTLNYIRTFPDYRRIQDFMEGRYPKAPFKPPYAIHDKRSTCAVQIASDNPNIIDNFSFEQARALAIEILENCKDHGGKGGFASIGHGIGWRVCVIGFKLPPDPPDSTDMFEGIYTGNGTSVPVTVDEA